MSNSSHANITKFAGQNFEQWKFQVHILLEEEEVLDFIADNAACPILANDNSNAEEVNTWKKKDARARRIICLALDLSLIALVSKATTAKEVWKALTAQYERTGLATTLYLRRKLYNLRMEEGASMLNHLNEVLSITQQLAAAKDEIKDKELVPIVLNSLPPSYQPFTKLMEIIPDISLEVLKSCLLQEDENRQENMNPHIENALFHKQRSTRTVPTAFRSMGKDKRPFCWYCKKRGHTVDNCFKLARKSNSKPQSWSSNGDGSTFVIAPTW